MKRLLSFPPISFTLEAFSTYGRCGVAQAAAALSYFLILTLFPLLMCVNYFIGLFHLSLEQLLSGLDQVLPDQALAVMQDYLAYADGRHLPPAALRQRHALRGQGVVLGAYILPQQIPSGGAVADHQQFHVYSSLSVLF